MAKEDDAPAEQILVIRRKSGGEDDCHHGGVWKIAYADFMTAMMAFFLVMWLINAANTETKARVASYFNPIKLTDSSSKRKGLLDPEERRTAPEGKGATTERPADQVPSGSAIGQPGDAQSNDRNAPEWNDVTSDPRARTPVNPGSAFRDPFNPLMPSAIRPSQQSNGGIAAGGFGAETGRAEAGAGAESIPSPVRDRELQEERASNERGATGGGHAAQRPGSQSSPTAAAVRPPIHSQNEPDAAATMKAQAAARVLQEVKVAARQIGLTGGPGIDVTVEPDGVVLSLTDTSTFGMFGIGSADPNAELVALMQTIAPIVTANSRRIIVRGHTDSRPYRTDKSNNWRLSMSRAEAVAAILVRGGIDEKRIERIEAHADRKPKLEKSPEAAANRRIEILLRPPAP